MFKHIRWIVVQVLKGMREAKRKQVELRANVLRELIEKPDGEEGAKGGFTADLARSFVDNFQLNLSDFKCGFRSELYGFACGAELPSLSILSVNQDWLSK